MIRVGVASARKDAELVEREHESLNSQQVSKQLRRDPIGIGQQKNGSKIDPFRSV